MRQFFVMPSKQLDIVFEFEDLLPKKPTFSESGLKGASESNEQFALGIKHAKENGFKKNTFDELPDELQQPVIAIATRHNNPAFIAGYLQYILNTEVTFVDDTRHPKNLPIHIRQYKANGHRILICYIASYIKEVDEAKALKGICRNYDEAIATLKNTNHQETFLREHRKKNLPDDHTIQHLEVDKSINAYSSSEHLFENSRPAGPVSALTASIFLFLGAATGAVLVATGIFAPMGLGIWGGVALAATLGGGSALLSGGIAYGAAKIIPTSITSSGEKVVKASAFTMGAMFLGATVGAVLVATGVFAPFGIGILGGVALAATLGGGGAVVAAIGSLVGYSKKSVADVPNFLGDADSSDDDTAGLIASSATASRIRPHTGSDRFFNDPARSKANLLISGRPDDSYSGSFGMD